MSYVSRAFAWRATRRGASYEPESDEFTKETYSATIHASGQALADGGHLEALDTLEKTVGSWLRINWDGALLIDWGDKDSKDLPRVAKKWTCAEKPGASYLAKYLLTYVCEPLLRQRGLLAYRVQIKIGAHSFDPEELEPETVEAYRQEQATCGKSLAQ